MIDLHTHSTVSDGDLNPEELVTRAFEIGISVLALTDHDSVGGIKRAAEQVKKINLQNESDKQNMRFISGIELNITWQPGECHLLGYGVDPDNSELLSIIELLQKGREERNKAIVELMNQNDMPASLSEISDLANCQTLGRPHFAKYMVKKGYVKNIQKAFDLYLAKNRKCYVENPGVPLDKAIAAINASGGVPVLAHPLSLYLSWSKLEDLLAEWKNLGLKGIEVLHPSFRIAEGQRMKALADKLGFIATAGSDFHGEGRKDRKLGYTCGMEKIDDIYIDALEKEILKAE